MKTTSIIPTFSDLCWRAVVYGETQFRHFIAELQLEAEAYAEDTDAAILYEKGITYLMSMEAALDLQHHGFPPAELGLRIASAAQRRVDALHRVINKLINERRLSRTDVHRN